MQPLSSSIAATVKVDIFLPKTTIINELCPPETLRIILGALTKAGKGFEPAKKGVEYFIKVLAAGDAFKAVHEIHDDVDMGLFLGERVSHQANLEGSLTTDNHVVIERFAVSDETNISIEVYENGRAVEGEYGWDSSDIFGCTYTVSRTSARDLQTAKFYPYAFNGLKYTEAGKSRRLSDSIGSVVVIREGPGIRRRERHCRNIAVLQLLRINKCCIRSDPYIGIQIGARMNTEDDVLRQIKDKVTHFQGPPFAFVWYNKDRVYQLEHAPDDNVPVKYYLNIMWREVTER
ncbi:hypothetical protein VTN77DRAFT_9322 [Rasamsonia byssochlamydoides]|uniref:uncharacterized protein n=1 Tax=Rasamsonia byssochlamydoides TaxID=89139 RepID=UPI003743F83C